MGLMSAADKSNLDQLVTNQGNDIVGNAGTATTLQTARAIDGVNFNGSVAISHYATCSTAAATAAKTCTISNFTLVTGARVFVRFSYANTAASPTLNVSSTGAKAIYYKNAAIPANYITQYTVLEMVYSGSYWYVVGDLTKYQLDIAETVVSSNDSVGLNYITVKVAKFGNGVKAMLANTTFLANLTKGTAYTSTNTLATTYRPAYDLVRLLTTMNGVRFYFEILTTGKIRITPVSDSITTSDRIVDSTYYV
jgi:hypothetical protein